MMLEGGYDIVTYSDSEDMQMPTLSPAAPIHTTTPQSKVLFKQEGGIMIATSRIINKRTCPPKRNSNTYATRAAAAAAAAVAVASSSASSFLDPLLTTTTTMAPIPISTSTSHINILRRKKLEHNAQENLLELANPLGDVAGGITLGGGRGGDGGGGPSSSASCSSSSAPRPRAPPSPFVGEPMMDNETGETMFPCLMCDKKYKLRSSLESHVKVHEGTENTCGICGQTMSRQRDLKRHVATVHRGLLMPDGTITYPPDIDELVPQRTRRVPKRRGGGGGGQDEGVALDFDSSSDVLECYSPVLIKSEPDFH